MSNSVYTSKIVSSEALTKSTALQLHDKATKNFPSCKRFMYNYHTVKQKVLRKAIEIHRNMHLLLIAMAIKMIAFPQIIIEALMKSWNSKRDIAQAAATEKKDGFLFETQNWPFFSWTNLVYTPLVYDGLAHSKHTFKKDQCWWNSQSLGHSRAFHTEEEHYGPSCAKNIKSIQVSCKHFPIFLSRKAA